MPFAQIIAAQAMRALMAQQRVTTDNLANSSTSGYQKGVVAFRTFGAALAGARQATTSTGAVPSLGQAPQAFVSLDPTAGRLEQTGSPLDLALEGRGWLVTGSSDAPRFVRSGSFTMDRHGMLVSSRGEPLLGEDGKAIHVEGRDIRIASDGTVSADGHVAGRLLRVDADPTALEKAGGQLAAVAPGALRPSQVPVRQGWLEGSNVEPVGQMVDMIQTLRSFDFLQHVVRAEDEMLQRAANDVGRTR